jgi:phage antirepressor YoqD-like protein
MMMMAKQVAEWQELRIQELKKELEESKPKAIVYDRIADSTGLKTIQEIANILGIGVNTFFKMLRDDGIFYKTNGINLPKAKYKKYFIMREEPYMHGENSQVYTRIFVNAEGELWLARKYGREV